ncbi:MAG TPA: RNA-binding protein [Polyangiaceae bacterium]|jgi:hypothetical protein
MSPGVAPTARLFDHLFVGGFPRGTTEAQLREAFAAHGFEVGGIELVIDRTNGLPRGFAFVTLLVGTQPVVDGVAFEQRWAMELDGQPLDVRRIPRR